MVLTPIHTYQFSSNTNTPQKSKDVGEERRKKRKKYVYTSLLKNISEIMGFSSSCLVDKNKKRGEIFFRHDENRQDDKKEDNRHTAKIIHGFSVSFFPPRRTEKKKRCNNDAR